MEAKRTYLKGKSVFMVSLVVVSLVALTVYLTGANYHRTVTSNLYLSLAVIGLALFVFLTVGLFKGIGLVDNFPKFQDYRRGGLVTGAGTAPDIPSIDVGDGIGGVIISVLFWIGMTIVVFLLMILLEIVLWLSIFILITTLYWLFFRALRVVFLKSRVTQGDIGKSVSYALMYTTLYLGWIFGIVYLADFMA